MSKGLACFWCTERFDGLPLHCPVRKLPNGSIACTEIVFCGFSCAKAHVLRDSRPAHDGFARLQLLSELAKKHGHHSVIAAPPRQALDKFGGPMSLAEFRNPTQELVLDPPGMLVVPTTLSQRPKRSDRGEAVASLAPGPGLVLERKRPSKRARKITMWFTK